MVEAERPSSRDHQESIEKSQSSSKSDEKGTNGPRLHYDLNLHEDRRGNRLRLEVPLEVSPAETNRSRDLQARDRDVTPDAPESPEMPERPDTP